MTAGSTRPDYEVSRCSLCKTPSVFDPCRLCRPPQLPLDAPATLEGME